MLSFFWCFESLRLSASSLGEKADILKLQHFILFIISPCAIFYFLSLSVFPAICVTPVNHSLVFTLHWHVPFPFTESGSHFFPTSVRSCWIIGATSAQKKREIVLHFICLSRQHVDSCFQCCTKELIRWNTTRDFGIKFLSIHPVFISVHHVSASHNINSNQNVLGLCELLFWLERKFVWILPTIPTAHEGTVKPELYAQSLSVGLPSCVPAPPPRSSCVLRVPAFLTLLDFGHELIIKTFFTLLSLCVLCLGPLFFDKLLTDRCSENGN